MADLDRVDAVAARSLSGGQSDAGTSAREDTQSPTLEELQQRALQEGEAGKTEQAIRDYQSALALQPAWKEGRWNLGSLQYSASRFEDARATFAQVVQFAPDLGVAWALLGLSEFEVKDYPDALVHLEKAHSLGVRDDAEVERVAIYHLGLLRIRSGEFEQATTLLMTAFGNAPMTTQLKSALGLATLRIPLLPDQVDPSQDALILSVGEAASDSANALARLREIRRLHPTIPYLNYACAMAAIQAGNSQDAIRYLQAEAAISPDSPLPWIALSRLEAASPALTAQPGTKAHTLQSAPIIEDRIVRLYAGTRDGSDEAARKSWQQALQEYSSMQYSQASRDLRVWLKAKPEDGTAWAMLGLCEYALKDYDNALIHLDRGAQSGLNGSPQSIAAAKYTFGILLVHAGEFERASEVLASVSGTEAFRKRIRYAMGLALLRKPELPAENHPEDKLISAAGEIAALLQQSKYDDAFPRFKRLLTEYPTTPFLHYAYGTALLALSEFEEASAEMHAEIAISPGSELPLLRLASIALRQHSAKEAIQWAGRALVVAPASAEGHYLLGRAALEDGDDATALEQLAIAGRLSPGSPEVHFNLAKAYDRANQPAKAEQERQTFARLNAATENQRSHQGPQIYSGPHDTGALAQPSRQSSSDSGSSEQPPKR